MIASLCGIILAKQEKSLILKVNGVGYLVWTTREFLEKTKEGEEGSFFIHTQVREDDISLYGFSSLEQWQFFRLLLTVSGVGPKLALEILNAPLSRVRQAIAKKDAVFLTHIPGIGKKTAERIIVDLQGKVKEELMEESTTRGNQEDIIQALISLGYQRQKVIEGLKKIPLEITREETIIKYFLQNV